MSEDLISISVVIADRPYKLKVKREEEEVVRNAAKKIKEQLRDLQQQYSVSDKQDHLAMATLLYCVETLTSKNAIYEVDEQLETKLDELDEILTIFLDI